MPSVVIENSVINAPFEELQRHFRFTDEIVDVRRRSACFVPIPPLYSTESFPFDAPFTGKIVIKAINHYGDEVLKVYDVMR